MSQVVNQQTFQYVCTFHQTVSRVPENSILYSSEQQKQESLKKSLFNSHLNQVVDEVCGKCGNFKYVVNTDTKNIFTCQCEQHISKQINQNIFKPGKSPLSMQIEEAERQVSKYFHISQRQKQNQIKQSKQSS